MTPTQLAERYNRVLIEYRTAIESRYFTLRDHALTYVGGGWYRQGSGNGLCYRADEIRARMARMEADTVEHCQELVRKRADQAPYRDDSAAYRALCDMQRKLPRQLHAMLLAFHGCTSIGEAENV